MNPCKTCKLSAMCLTGYLQPFLQKVAKDAVAEFAANMGKAEFDRCVEKVKEHTKDRVNQVLNKRDPECTLYLP